jgi:hypothetical protein
VSVTTISISGPKKTLSYGYIVFGSEWKRTKKLRQARVLVTSQDTQLSESPRVQVERAVHKPLGNFVGDRPTYSCIVDALQCKIRSG